MSPFIATCLSQWELNRARTLAKLDEIEKQPDGAAILGWRPGTGRAHIAWQLMHIAVTEELFATERLAGTTPGYQDLLSRYRGGSTPDDQIPTFAEIREVLATARQHLIATVEKFTEVDLATVTTAMKERGLNIGQCLQLLAWHEAHHQGQTHLTYNLWKVRG